MRRGVHRIHIRNLGALQLLFDVQACWHIWQLLGSRRDAAEERALARPDGDEEVHWPDQTGMRIANAATIPLQLRGLAPEVCQWP